MPGGWYVKIEGRRAGPLTAAQLKAFAQRGQIKPTDLVRQEGGGPWVPAGRVKGLFTVVATAAPVPAKAAPPALPEPPAVAPAIAPAAAEGFRVVGDSPTDRVLRRGHSGRGRAWYSSTTFLGATAAVMLIAVSAVGIAMIRSGDGQDPVAPPAAAPVAAKAAAESAEPSPEKPPAAVAASTEGKKWDLGIEGLEGLEDLGILDSPGGKPKPPPPKLAEVAAETPAQEPDRPAAPLEEEHKLAAAPAEETTKTEPRGKAAEGREADVADAAPSDDEPGPDVSKIKTDIAALGGGESDLDYGGDAPPEPEPKKPAAKSGQKSGGQRAGKPQPRDGEKDADRPSPSRPQDGGQKGGAARTGGQKESDARPAPKPLAKRNAAKK